MNARLEDLGSTNGTFVDGERVESAELSDRSEFRIGFHEFVFVMRDQDVE
jgi:pSer/pThr/pTyr-binding forkhead associated (FHA) protein